MLAIAWNCQGLGNPLMVSNLVDLCICHRPNLVCLSETKPNQLKFPDSIEDSNFRILKASMQAVFQVAYVLCGMILLTSV